MFIKKENHDYLIETINKLIALNQEMNEHLRRLVENNNELIKFAKDVKDQNDILRNENERLAMDINGLRANEVTCETSSEVSE